MMKNDKPNYTDIENLSAYLDHELSEDEENQLRSRLAQDASLRDELEDLRLTRYTLRHTPKVRRQRSFTLTPEMVKKQKFAWRAINFSRMVAAAASVLFLLVIGGEILFSGQAGLIASAPAENAAMVQEAAEMESPMAAEDIGEGGVAEDSVEVPMEEPMEALIVPEAEEEAAAEEPAEEPAPIEPSPTEWGVGGGAPPEETATPTFSGPEERTMPSTKAAEETITVEEMPLAGASDEGDGSETNQLEGDDTAEMIEPVEPPETDRAPVPLVRWVQGGLLLVAIFSGALAIYFRRTLR